MLIVGLKSSWVVDSNTGSEPMTWQSLPLLQAHISLSNSMKGQTEIGKKKTVKGIMWEATTGRM